MIAARIAQLRTQLGWTQMELAKRLGLNLKTIRNWENSSSYPSAPNIIRLCQLFSVSADYLLGIDSQSAIRLFSLSEQDRQRLTAMVQAFINFSTPAK